MIMIKEKVRVRILNSQGSGGVRMQVQTSDEAHLRQLNEEYIDAFMKADVNWYEQNLTEDFTCIESDGSLLDKAAFLRLAAKGPDVLEYRLDRVKVRIYGDTALVQATGLFTKKDASTGISRYTDVYVRMGMEWKAVAAQITRSSNPV
jgi:ketosteroid isomerase-like protein